MNHGVGQAYGLSMILDIHNLQIFNSTSEYFVLSLNQDIDFFNVGTQGTRRRSMPAAKTSSQQAPSFVPGIKIYPGHQVEIDFTLEERGVSDSFLELPLETRKCRTIEENFDESLFSVYTQKGCQFECTLKEAQKICGCTAWNYPRGKDYNDVTCYGTSAKCYKRVINDVSVQRV